MKNTLPFLKELTKNNTKEWFTANKPRYQAIQKDVNDFTEQLIAGIAKFDPTIAGLTVKDCSYRIYRDTRFSKDKTPYKTHIGIFICKGGKCSGNAGYYFHIEPKDNAWLGGCMLAVGLYHPEPIVLKSVREDILSNGANFLKTIKAANGFDWDDDNEEKLSRPPKGFPADSPYIEYIKQKNFSLVQDFDEKLLADPKKLVDFCVSEFKKTKAFAEHVNRAVDFAREEN
ncbi:MAG: DUF2461 domain-containing protein [Bacteroidales bacterium]|jgi:uncharacterized protein (TIGR02453 family)|nr:DUF2461 domain-containing protein [Bacteroidales bacterium]